MNNDRHILLHLSLIEGVGPGAVSRILSALFQKKLAELYSYSIVDMIERYNCTRKQAQALFVGLQDKKLLEYELELLEKYCISYVTILDPEYPALLRQIQYPPPVLYVKGTLTNNQKCLAVVGSRKANNYTQRALDYMIPHLVANDWHIVSGGALGADAMAHRATLKAGGSTTVVLGSGLLRLGPKSNMQLFKDIVERGGTLVSSFPLQAEGLKGNFPARNRIISGMSRGCFVLQAAERSGASITASFALEQGREVFTLPGSIFDELSVGCHRLAQQGAKLVMQADDILVEFGENIQLSPDIKKTVQLELLPEQLSPEDKILSLCRNSLAIDALIEQTGSSLETVQIILFDLQLQGKISQTSCGGWQAL